MLALINCDGVCAGTRVTTLGEGSSRTTELPSPGGGATFTGSDSRVSSANFPPHPAGSLEIS